MPGQTMKQIELPYMEFDSAVTVIQGWKDFNIVHCISAINESLDEVKASTINACWQRL